MMLPAIRPALEVREIHDWFGMGSAERAGNLFADTPDDDAAHSG
jgi:hypothetical protein